METVQRLTATGITQFREYLQHLRDGSTTEAPRSLLADQKTSEPFESSRAIDDQTFPTRLEAARYLTELFDGIEGLEEDIGLWSWLSLFYFDQVCPLRPDGTRLPGRDYRHILEPGFHFGHRHLLGGPFLVYRQHGERAALLLASKIHQESTFHHQLASRQAFISNSTIIEAANRLYLDRHTQQPKRGAQKRNGPGTLFRFVDVVQQLDLNYDLYSMSTESLIKLLSKESDAWRRSRGSSSGGGRRRHTGKIVPRNQQYSGNATWLQKRHRDSCSPPKRFSKGTSFSGSHVVVFNESQKNRDQAN